MSDKITKPMKQTGPNQSQISGCLNQLLKHPVLFTLLLLVSATLVLLTGAAVYLFIGRRSVAAVPTATSTQAVQFATSTPPIDTTVTVSPTSSSAPSIALLPVQGDAGTLVTITGRNWTPDDTVVVRVEDPTGSQGLQPLSSNAIVAGNGTFITSLLLPANTGWDNLSGVHVTVESSETGTRTAAEFSIINLNQRPTPIPTDDQPIETSTPPFPLPPDLANDDDDDDDLIPLPPFPIPPRGNWQGEYFNNPNLIGPPVLVRNEFGIDFDWGFGSPAPSIPFDSFSARWLLTESFDVALYRFHITADDGIRLWVNDELIVDEWFARNRRTVNVDYTVPYRGLSDIRLEYADFSAEASVEFWWEKILNAPPDTNVPYYEWRGAYWANVNLFGEPVFVRGDPGINFDWQSNSPAPGLPTDNFSIRWERIVDFEPTSYRFYLTINDGARVWIDGYLFIDEWQDGNTREITRDFTMRGGPHEIRVEYYDRSGDATVRLRWDKGAAATPIPFYPDWQAEYWSNPNLTGSPTLIRNDPVINFNWGSSSASSPLPSDNFSVRWSRSFTFENGLYRFSAEVNDGIRLFLDGNLVLNEWHDSSNTQMYNVNLNLNGRHWLVVEYYDRTGEARIRFDWQQINTTVTPSPSPTLSPDADTTIPVTAAKFDLWRRSGVPISQINVTSVTYTEWRDSNLGCPEVGSGAEVITPGYLIIMEANGRQYEYHTDEGVYVLLCNGTVPSAPTNTPIPPAVATNTPISLATATLTITPIPTSTQTITSTPPATDTVQPGNNLPVEIPSR